MDRFEGIETINRLAGAGVPFLMISDFLGNQVEVWPLSEINPNEILYDIRGITNMLPEQQTGLPPLAYFTKHPVPYSGYETMFHKVMYHLNRGDSYLVNLTGSTPVLCNLSLRDICLKSRAKYRLYLKDRFTVFSPEIFVQIKGGNIFSFPMKGTIDARLPNAEILVLNDPKEAAEHATIVDLIRNDLSKIASQVTVDNYRYIDRLETSSGPLLQVSSKISGTLGNTYPSQLGTLLFELLPAGSISGAPKAKTLEIIQKAETHERGFYTGIVGLFDGNDFDSGVLIRFIEEQNGQLIFKSGGGITANSQCSNEYHELIQKVYLPFRN